MSVARHGCWSFARAEIPNTLLLPYSPLTLLLGFVPLPAVFLLALFPIVMLYAVVAEVAKSVFYRQEERRTETCPAGLSTGPIGVSQLSRSSS